MADSPAKKLDFDIVGKENVLHDVTVVKDVELKKPILEIVKKDAKPPAPPTPKELEAEEPLLRENPNRFVLFPIKYHEVSP
jgi:ribonucleoside-diphosphate reductase subunit M2